MVVREKMVRRITLVSFRMWAKLFLWRAATNSHKARGGIVILTISLQGVDNKRAIYEVFDANIRS